MGGVESGYFPRKPKCSLSESSAVTFLAWRPVSCCLQGQGQEGMGGRACLGRLLAHLGSGVCPLERWAPRGAGGGPDVLESNSTPSLRAVGGAHGQRGSVWTHWVVVSLEFRVLGEETDPS